MPPTEPKTNCINKCVAEIFRQKLYGIDNRFIDFVSLVAFASFSLVKLQKRLNECTQLGARDSKTKNEIPDQFAMKIKS